MRLRLQEDLKQREIGARLDISQARLVRREAAPDARAVAWRRNSRRAVALNPGPPQVGPAITQNVRRGAEEEGRPQRDLRSTA